MTEDDLYSAARDKTDATERATYLDRACAGDPDLRQRIESRLTEPLTEPLEDAPKTITVGPAAAVPGEDCAATAVFANESVAPVTAELPAHLPGTHIGPYKLARVLGEGGMGVVYLAEQERPVRRRVALKIIKYGADSGALLARFNAERQALALMDHANIARVLDAGATDGGRPYFVMELVEGVPITRYCDDHRLSVRQRLELFIPVCRAIQHAHQKGIIHRDIKPTNVLVVSRDGRPVPSVIDFGIAKAIEQKLTDATLVTGFGAVMGTLEYMSPEQASANTAGIDTRSDVYSLGILLYELLAGSTPLSHTLQIQSNYGALLQSIREDETRPPSAHLRGCKELVELAARRGTEPARLRRLVRGELDWITLKALEKDRARRYETADALARDLERFLQNEPVEAGPPSAWYRWSKFARRHRILLGVSSAAALLLVAATGVSIASAIRAFRAEGDAREQKKRADTEAATARAVSAFLQNDLLQQASSEVQGGAGIQPDPDVKVRTLLDRAAQRIDGKFEGQPEVEAAIRRTIGTTYARLGNYQPAERNLDRARQLYSAARGADDPFTLGCTNALAVVYEAQGNLDAARALLEQVLDGRRRVLGERDPDTLLAMNNLGLCYRSQGQYDKAEFLLLGALKERLRIFGRDHPDTLASLNNLAVLYETLRRIDKAEPLLASALEGRIHLLGEEHPNTLATMNNLGALYRATGQFAKAELLLNRSLAGRRRVLGDRHPDTLSSLVNLGLLHCARGEYVKAEPLFQEALAGRRALLGEQHPDTLAALTNLGLALESKGDYAGAEPLLQKAFDGRQRALGAEHPDTLTALNNLGVLFLLLHQLDKAEAQLNKALDGQRRHLGPDHPNTILTETNLARVFNTRREFAKAESLLEHVLSVQRQSEGDKPQTAATLIALGANRLDQHRFADAESVLDESDRYYAMHDPNSWQLSLARGLLGGSLLGQKKYDAAEPRLLSGYEGLKESEANLPTEAKARIAEIAGWLAQLYEARGQKERADHWRQEMSRSIEGGGQP